MSVRGMAAFPDGRGAVDNGDVPFTLSHAAAALPLRRLRLVPSALVVGTFAPDFEYFLRSTPHGGFPHTLKGVFVFDLPMALLALWAFHALVKAPLVALLPEAVQRRLTAQLARFRFLGGSRLALIVVSILLGIATHLLWDSFTHRDTWPYRHVPLLSQLVTLPVLGPVPYFKLLQHISTVVGLAILGVWLLRWFERTEPAAELPASRFSTGARDMLRVVVPGVALAAALVRAGMGVSLPLRPSVVAKFAAVWVVTLIAVAWWALVACGLVWLRRGEAAQEPAGTEMSQ